jgi:hypothetical protein
MEQTCEAAPPTIACVNGGCALTPGTCSPPDAGV